MVSMMARLLLETREGLDDVLSANRALWLVKTTDIMISEINQRTKIYQNLNKDTRGSPHTHRAITVIRTLSESEEVDSALRAQTHTHTPTHKQTNKLIESSTLRRKP